MFQELGGFGGTVVLPKPGVGTSIGETLEAPEEPRGVSQQIRGNVYSYIPHVSDRTEQNI